MNTLRDLQKYTISKDFFEVFKHTEKKSDNRDIGTQAKKKNQQRVPVGDEEKTHSYKSLFWTFYSLINNEHTTSMIEHHKFKIKNDFSLRFVSLIKNNKGFLKQNKLKFHDIESSILYNDDITIDTLKALVLFNKMNVCYIWNNKYYIFESNDEDVFHVIKRVRETFTFNRNVTRQQVMENEVSKKILMDNTRTQLKSVSSYKLEDLKQMALLLDIDINIHKTKLKLYNEINRKID